MRPKRITITVVEDTAAIAASQSPGAGDLELSGGTLSFASHGQKISLTSGASDNLFSFTLFGIAPGANEITSEVITGPGMGLTVTSLNYYEEVTQITASSSVTSLSAGWDEDSISKPVVVNCRQSPFNMSLTAEIDSGSGTFAIEHTVDDPEGAFTTSFSDDAFWLSSTDEGALVASTETNLNFPVTAVRVLISVSSALVLKFTVIQGQNG